LDHACLMWAQPMLAELGPAPKTINKKIKK